MINTANAPASGHYKELAIEPIELIAALHLDFMEGSFVKYLCRHPHKGDPETDLKKAKFYFSKMTRVENSLSCSDEQLCLVEFFCKANNMDEIETKCLRNALDGFREDAVKSLDELIARYDEPA